MGNKYKQYDESKVNRDHGLCVMGVHKETGLFFAGKKTGTHIGYPSVGSVKKAMSSADRDSSEYYFIGLAMTTYGLPTITLLEGVPNQPSGKDAVEDAALALKKNLDRLVWDSIEKSLEEEN